MNARRRNVTRRRFIKETIGGAAVVAGTPAVWSGVEAVPQSPGAKLPWYRRAYLWGQTNITEKDPVRYDIDWWRGYWKRTQVQAVIINAGGIVAYYPSRFPLHHRVGSRYHRTGKARSPVASHRRTGTTTDFAASWAISRSKFQPVAAISVFFVA